MIKVVFFDLDGTLLDSELYWRQAGLRLLVAKGVAMPQDILEQQDSYYFRATVKELLSRPHIAKQVNMTYEECIDWCFEDMARLYRMVIQLKPHALELLCCVKALGLKTALVTATKPEDAKAILTRFDLHEYFDMVHSTYGQTENKSKPELFERLAAQLGAQTDECVLVDDTRYALEGARKAGCQAWAVEEPVHKLKVERIKATANCYFETLADVEKALKETM